MTRPTHPRHNGLREPQPTEEHKESIRISPQYDNQVSLQTINLAWNKLWLDITNKGGSVVGEPHLRHFNYNERISEAGMFLECTYAVPNPHYAVAKESYDRQIAEYENALALYNNGEEASIKDHQRAKIQAKIDKVKTNLVNLETKLAQL